MQDALPLMLLPYPKICFTGLKIPSFVGERSIHKGRPHWFIQASTDTSQIRNQLNERLATQSLDTLYEELKQVDECFALSISRNDKQRIQRGLEIHHATGIPISEHWKAQKHDQTTCPSKS